MVDTPVIYEALLLTKVLAGSKESWLKLANFGFRPDLLYHPFDEVFAFIDDYVSDHGELPPRATILETQDPDLAELLFVETVPEEPATAIYDRIREQKQKIEVRDLIKEAKNAYEIDTDPDEILKKLQMGVMQTQEGFQRVQTESLVFGDSVQALIDELDEVRANNGAPIPFHFLNDAVGGLNPSEITTIVAKPGVGKTWALLMCAATSAMGNPFHFHLPAECVALEKEEKREKQRKVLIVSLEMDVRAVQRRLASLLTRVSYPRIKNKVLTTEERALYTEGLYALNDPSEGSVGANLKIVGPNQACDPDSVARQAEDFEADVVMIDGFYYMTGPGDERWQRVESNMQTMRLHTLMSGRHYMLATQFRREAKTLKSADLDALAFSASVGHDSNNVLALLPHSRIDKDEILVVPLKIRDGAVGVPYRYTWNHRECKYEELGIFVEEGMQAQFQSDSTSIDTL